MLNGIYHDEVTGADGVRRSRGWRHNAIVESCNRLLASLMRGEEGVEGILFWAVGTGDPAWDGAPPSPSPAATTLHDERARLALAPAQIEFIDANGDPSAAPTARLRITAEFLGDELAPEGFVSLREFGVFGGDATAAADTGQMVDYAIHPRIDLSPGVVLRRTLHLSFQAATVVGGGGGGGGEGGGEGGFGAGLPVAGIHGVDEAYGAALTARGATTIGALAALDPRAPAGAIPPAVLLDLHTRARMVTGLRVDLAPFAALAGRTLGDLLLTRPEVIAAEEVGAGLTAGTVARLQDELAVLQVALDDRLLGEATLADLQGSRRRPPERPLDPSETSRPRRRDPS